ncbi:AB hydrolase-1 domain-containing protein [Heracleum sosnowskyi]|uniref:AB hydrolase-1 domain-containing protein n=1 Tax=Heracleum sosnowskyi TaxID=360622 RepID=A0AAD8HZM1_9APIA|nr:AB hydrolase-1 domain-containing protein [Heracleum sosnowskyi]
MLQRMEAAESKQNHRKLSATSARPQQKHPIQLPSVTASRIKLRDLAYKEHGVPKDTAKYKIVYVHGFTSCRHYTVSATTLTLDVIEDLGIYIVSFDRPGYGESDPNPNQTVKSISLDVEELADQLGLGLKFYVIGYSMGGQLTWSCLKYITHRLAGAILIAPVVNYWWPAQSPGVLSRQDSELVSVFSTAERKEFEAQVRQQGEYVSLHRDLIIGFGTWEFDPMELKNPFPSNEEVQVHLWQGDEDMIVPVTLQRHIDPHGFIIMKLQGVATCSLLRMEWAMQSSMHF